MVYNILEHKFEKNYVLIAIFFLFLPAGRSSNKSFTNNAIIHIHKLNGEIIYQAECKKCHENT